MEMAAPPSLMVAQAPQFRQAIFLRAPTTSFPSPPNSRNRCSLLQPPNSARWWCHSQKPKNSIAAAPTESALTDVVTTEVSAPTPQTAEDLRENFGRPGLIFFETAPGVPAAELKLRNGTRARVVLPKAQIISYKPHMWHGGEEEWLYAPSASSSSSSRARTRSRDGGVELGLGSIVGGIELRFSGGQQVASGSDRPPALFAERWTVEGVDCEPAKYAQITLTCSSIRPVETVHGGKAGGLQGRCVVTLTEHYLSSALVLSNTGLPSVELTCSIATHLAIRSLEGAMAVGLNGQRVYCRSGRPVSQSRPSKLSATLGNVFSRALGGFKAPQGKVESAKSDNESRADDNGNAGLGTGGGQWGVESDDYLELRGGDDRVYPSPPDSFTFLDRGFRRSLRMEKMGFREFFLSNPGPASNLAKWDSFVCLGPAETMNSVTIAENESWQGAQILWNTGSD